MDDPRLLTWLELTESALSVPEPELVEILSELDRQRSEIRESLEQNPPTQRLSDALGQQLIEIEDTLHKRIAAIRGTIDNALGELREVRTGTQGYRPARTRLPSFISKSV